MRQGQPAPVGGHGFEKLRSASAVGSFRRLDVIESLEGVMVNDLFFGGSPPSIDLSEIWDDKTNDRPLYSVVRVPSNGLQGTRVHPESLDGFGRRVTADGCLRCLGYNKGEEATKTNVDVWYRSVILMHFSSINTAGTYSSNTERRRFKEAF
jgi:hypothetical protein